jgi:integrase
MTENEIKFASNYIANIALEDNGAEKVNIAIQSLLSTYLKEASLNAPKNNDFKPLSTIITFSQKEINLMPKTFRKEFRADGCTAHVRKRKCGKNHTYEIRYRKNGYNVTVTNKNLEIAKQLFIEKLKVAKPVTGTSTHISEHLHTFAMYYFEKFRLPKVATRTYEADLHRYKKYIQPAFGDRQLQSITPEHCQNLIDTILAEGKGKTAEEIHSLLSIIFKGAIAHGLMDKNPLNLVVRMKHEGKHGTALTKAEETVLLNAYPNTKYQTLFALALYTGLRPNEYNTAKIEGKFIIAVNSKRKNKRVEYKRIPITPMLAPYLQGINEFEMVNRDVIREKFKAVLPNHIVYDMRTTFYSRCKECGIADAARDEFVGHSLGALGNAYTDLSDEYLLKEGAKFKY